MKYKSDTFVSIFGKGRPAVGGDTCTWQEEFTEMHELGY